MSTASFARDVAYTLAPTVLMAAAGAALAWKRRSISTYLVASGFNLSLLCTLAIAVVAVDCGLDFSQAGPFGCVFGTALWLTYMGYFGMCLGSFGLVWYALSLKRNSS